MLITQAVGKSFKNTLERPAAFNAIRNAVFTRGRSYLQFSEQRHSSTGSQKKNLNMSVHKASRQFTNYKGKVTLVGWRKGRCTRNRWVSRT